MFNIWSESAKDWMLGQSVVSREVAEAHCKRAKTRLVEVNQRRVERGHPPLVDDYEVRETDVEWTVPGLKEYAES